MNIVIGFDPDGTSAICAICEFDHDRGPGVGLYRLQGMEPVCADCGRLEDPTLTTVLEMADIAWSYGMVALTATEESDARKRAA